MTATQVILDNLLDLAMVFLAAVVPILARQAIAWLERRTGLDVSEAQERKAQEMLDRALHYAEESAHKRLRRGEVEMSTGAAKMAKAVAFARGEAERLGLDRVLAASAEHLEDMLEARLGQKRHDPDDAMDATPTAITKSAVKMAAIKAAEGGG